MEKNARKSLSRIRRRPAGMTMCYRGNDNVITSQFQGAIRPTILAR